MKSRWALRLSLFALVAAAAFVAGFNVQHRQVFSQDTDPASSIVPLSKSEFDTPEAPIRNSLYAIVHRDNDLYFASFGQEWPEGIDFSEIDFVLPVPELTGVVFESREELAEDRIEIHARPVGTGWNQSMPDVYTVEKGPAGWVISDLRSYGPDEGGHGRYLAAWPRRPSVDPLVGVWLNEDVNTQSITRIELSIENNELISRIWGACSPSDCYWGTARATVSADDPSKPSLVYIKSFANIVVTMSVDGDRLTCSHSTVFKDDSGRTGQEHVETFKRS